ncbi:glycosyl hydrolase family 28 protein [Serratia fonticola]
MTVSTEVSREEYTGNGVTTDFDYRFRVFSAEDLVVSVADTTETITVLTLNTDYTVTGAGSRTGGKVKLLSPLAFNWRISIERALPVTQETDIRNQGNFFPEVHEDAFDKLTMLIQQVWSYFWLALRRPNWLAKYYDAKGYQIASVGDPHNPQDAATKNYVDSQVANSNAGWQAGDETLNNKIDANFNRTLRVPESYVDQLPPADQRANSLQGYNSSGKPVPIFSMTDTADLAIQLAGSNGAGLVGYQQPGDGAIHRTVLTKILESAISVLEFKLPEEGDYIDNALRRLIAAIKSGVTKSRTILIPGHIGEWLCSSQVLFDVSDITVLVFGNVRLASTDRQKTFLFSYDINQAPAQYIHDITLIGNGSTINGNGSAMTFEYHHGDGSDNDSTVRFNYVDNVKVYSIHADNGPIDSFSFRQCRNWYVDGCTFSRSKEDNGFSVTTDWTTWQVGVPSTWGYGVIKNCVAYDNEDFGFTAFNATGVKFNNCTSFNNRAGFSYEDSFNSPGVKRFFGIFSQCSAYNCREQGYYIQCDGIRIDDTCRSWNIRGYEGDNSAGIFENGVVVSNIATCYVGGSHEQCGHSGVAIFNGNSRPTAVTVSGTYSWNDGPCIYGRGVGELTIVPGTAVRGGGRQLFNGLYSYGIDVSNNGGAGYFQNFGFVKADGVIIRDCGLGAIRTQYVGTTIVGNCNMLNNAAMGASPAISVEHGNLARVSHNHAPSDTGNQTFVVSIASSTGIGIEYLNTGDGTSGVAANNAFNKQQTSRAEYYLSSTYDAGSVAAGSQVAINLVVNGASVGDFVSPSFSSTIGRLMPFCEIPSDNNVVVYLRNFTSSSISYSSGQIRVLVTKRASG